MLSACCGLSDLFSLSLARPAQEDVKDGSAAAPVILQRLPATDHMQLELPGGMEMFCQPGGPRLSVARRPETFFPTVLTTLQGEHLYCGIFTFDELVPDTALYAPRSFCLISRAPLFDVFQTLLSAVYRLHQAGQQRIEPAILHMIFRVPMPPQGGTMVRMSLGPSLPRLDLSRAPRSSFGEPHNSVAILFELLDVPLVLQIFTAGQFSPASTCSKEEVKEKKKKKEREY